MPVIIRNLDQIEIEAADTEVKLKAQKARFSDAGAYVEFASTTELGYKDSEEVRRVRKAVRRDSKLTGANGTFIYPTATPTGGARPVKFDIFGEQGRIKLRSQLSAADVWRLLTHIQRAESWGHLAKEQTH